MIAELVFAGLSGVGVSYTIARFQDISERKNLLKDIGEKIDKKQSVTFANGMTIELSNFLPDKEEENLIPIQKVKIKFPWEEEKKKKSFLKSVLESSRKITAGFMNKFRRWKRN